MTDHISRHVANNEHLAISWIDASSVVPEIAAQHRAVGAPQQALAEVILSALALSTRLKGQGTVSVSCESTGDGLKNVRADAMGLGSVRGMVRPHGDDLSPEQGLEAGKFTVQRQLAGTDNPYRSVSESDASSPIARMNEFLRISEQVQATVIPDVVLADNMVQRARALYVEVLPGAPEPGVNEITDMVRGWIDGQVPRLNWAEIADGVAVTRHLFGAEACIELRRYDVQFFCPCSRERFVNGLRGFAQEELKSLVNDHGIIETTCDFCQTQYDIPLDEVL